MTEKNLFPEAWQVLYDALNPFTNREELAQKSGLIARGTLANRDSEGCGIPNRIRCGKKIVYPKRDAVIWLMALCDEKAGS